MRLSRVNRYSTKSLPHDPLPHGTHAISSASHLRHTHPRLHYADVRYVPQLAIIGVLTCRWLCLDFTLGGGGGGGGTEPKFGPHFQQSQRCLYMFPGTDHPLSDVRRRFRHIFSFGNHLLSVSYADDVDLLNVSDADSLSSLQLTCGEGAAAAKAMGVALVGVLLKRSSWRKKRRGGDAVRT